MIESISAVTLATADMARAVRFYRALGFVLRYGGEAATFTSFAVGAGHLNLELRRDPVQGGWGRVVFHVDDVDRLYAIARRAGFVPATQPRDAEWGERYFHLVDPDGHELSFARPLDSTR
jgi:catechol 2,3-dioxygenase-like lactoylglutathione lyase family enzyme